jgi:site-specific recombinase XerD
MNIADFITARLPTVWNDALVNDWLGAMRSFFDFLYLGGAVDRVAPRFLRGRPRGRRLPRTLTQDQVKKLIKAASDPRNRAIIELYYATGCRTSELLTIRVEDINFRERTLRVIGKRNERVVYFGPPASRAIRHYLGRRAHGYLFQDRIPSQSGYITCNLINWIGCHSEYKNGNRKRVQKYLGAFNTTSRAEAEAKFKKYLEGIDLLRPKPKRPLNKSTVTLAVLKAGQKAGLGRVTTRMLRHSFATHLLERGADIRAIQEIMGHTYLTSTQIYTRITNKAVASMFKRFHPRGA